MTPYHLALIGLLSLVPVLAVLWDEWRSAPRETDLGRISWRITSDDL